LSADRAATRMLNGIEGSTIEVKLSSGILAAAIAPQDPRTTDRVAAAPKSVGRANGPNGPNGNHDRSNRNQSLELGWTPQGS